jgi:hypothetical protein
MTDEPDEPNDDPQGTVLAPEELDITADQHVVELDDGRFLISAEDEPVEAPDALDDLDVGPSEPTADSPPPTARELDAEAVHAWLADRLEDADSRYGFDITAVFEGSVVRQELFSDDVTATFENLLVWYAQHVGSDTPVEDVLGILIARSTAPIRLPPNAVREIAEAYGLSPDDRLDDLYAAVEREGGLRFRPKDPSG